MPDPAPVNPPAPATSWTTGLDADVLGHVQNTGWATKTADEAAREASKAHREAAKFIGVPADQILRLPAKGAAPEAWTPVYERLGAPKEAKDYDFSTVKFKDGSVLDAGFVEAARKAAVKVHASKEGAIDIAREMVTLIEAQETSDATTSQAALLAEKSKLRDSWGKNYDSFEVVAKRTAEVLGVAPEAITALETQIGYAAVKQMFYNIGTKIGEDSFIRKLPGSENSGAMTKEQASARKLELMGDAAWSKRYLEGGVAEEREFQSLIRIERSDN